MKPTATLHHDNSLDVLKNTPDNTFDLTVTSPPYDNLRTYKDSLEWGEHVWKPLLEELFRTTKQGGVVVWVVGDATVKGSETGTSFKQALFAMECGFSLHDTMIYAKDNYVPLTHNRYEQSFEYMFIFSKGRPKSFNGIKVPSKCAGKSVSRNNTNRAKEGSTRNREEVTIIQDMKLSPNIFQYVIGKKTDNGNHTAAFPEQLALDHILSWSNEGDTVFDPFLGSGTTGKMSVLNGRNFVGVEKVEEYYQISDKRIKDALNSL